MTARRMVIRNRSRVSRGRRQRSVSGALSTMATRFRSAPGVTDFGGNRGDDLEKVTDDPERRDLEDRRVRITIDCHDVVGALQPDVVLHRATDGDGHVEACRDCSAGWANLLVVSP